MPTHRGIRGLATVLGCAAGGLLLAACFGSSSPAPHPAQVTDLTATAAVQATLLDAAAAELGLPAHDFTGVAPGSAYYAFDPADHLHWAGAALVPSRSSMRAQVAVQDDGGYFVFTRSGTAAWHVYLDGLGGAQDARCAIVVPKAVRKVWGWSLSTPCGVAPNY